LGALSNGRVTLTSSSNCFMNMALTIAVRYSAIRRQFGSEDGNEIPIIEYQLHVGKVFFVNCENLNEFFI
jgi:acyl-CoA oxidase